MTLECSYSDELAKKRGFQSYEVDLTFAVSRGVFVYESRKPDTVVEVRCDGDQYSARLNGSADITDEQREENRLQTDGLEFYRNYYEYLFGLPMKLADPGTTLDPEVRKTDFQGQEVLAVRVKYEPPVGELTWYFYFLPDTYRLVGCRFFKDESKNDGEYIVFEGEISDPAGMRLPEARSWYMNIDGKYLGTDKIAVLGVSALP